jgi:predicted RNA-binding protein YlxR (DUF448 family)
LLARVQEQNSELDTGPRSVAPGSERTCAVTRTVKPVDEMIRFVLGPDGVVPDLKRKLPGRGIWVTATREMLTDAVRRKLFTRGFKRDVAVPANFVAATELLLERAALDALAIAGKAGQVVAGFSKVESALVGSRVAALLHASDAGADGVAKIARVVRHLDRDPPQVIRTFTSAQLDLALGRPNVIHAALLAGPSSDTFLARTQRLERFRAGEPGRRALGAPRGEKPEDQEQNG